MSLLVAKICLDTLYFIAFYGTVGRGTLRAHETIASNVAPQVVLFVADRFEPQSRDMRQRLAVGPQKLHFELDHLLCADLANFYASDQFGSSVQLDVSRAPASPRSGLDHELVLAARLQRYFLGQKNVGTVYAAHGDPRDTLPPIPSSRIHQFPTKKLRQGSVLDFNTVLDRAVAVRRISSTTSVWAVVGVGIRRRLAQVLRRVAGLVANDLLDPSLRSGNS
jgi:hypothetical protein